MPEEVSQAIEKSANSHWPELIFHHSHLQNIANIHASIALMLVIGSEILINIVVHNIGHTLNQKRVLSNIDKLVDAV